MDNLALAILESRQLETRRKSPKEMSFVELVETFLSSLDVKPQSVRTYARQLKQYREWLDETGKMEALSLMSREDILEYKGYLSKRLSAYSVSGYLTAVRKLYTWLESEKVFPNIARDVKGAKKPRNHAKDTLSAEQLRLILSGIEQDEARDELERLRDYALLNLMARTALRDIEVSRARIGDIRNQEGSPVLWIQGKGRDSHDEFVILTQEALEPILAYLEARGERRDEAALFASLSRRNKGQTLSTRSISRVIKQAMRAQGIDSKRLTAHSLRHTAITMALASGATIQQAQAMARHADPKTTMIYARNLHRVTQAAERFIEF